MIRAKFQVTHTHPHYYGGKTVRLVAIYDPKIPESQQFAEVTPAGNTEMIVTNSVILEQCEVGQSFYVDFTLAED